MTTFGPDGPMINRRHTVDKDQVNVDVTHEEDEASQDDDDNQAEIDLAEAEDEAGERGEDEPVYPRAVDVDGDRWVVAEKPKPIQPTLLQERLKAFVTDQPMEPYRADPVKLDALREELRANFTQTSAPDPRLAVLDDVIVDMRRLAEKFDAQVEKMTRRQMRESVARIAFAVADVAEAVKRAI